MEQCNLIMNEQGFTIEAGTLRIKNLEDILLKKSSTDVGESLKAYILSKMEGKETIETSNFAKVIEANKDSIKDSIKILQKDANE